MILPSSSTASVAPAAMLPEPYWQQINQAIAPLDSHQLTWLSGYLAGLAQSQHTSVAAPPAAAENVQLTLLYGSQTGNARGLAEAYAEQLTAAGIANRVLNMTDFKPRQIKQEQYVVICVSTHGEGEPPDDALPLHQFLTSAKAPDLSHLRYAVLGLGDSSYEFFCQTAKDFDQRLSKLGATAILPRLEADVDYQADADNWFTQLLEVARQVQVSEVQVAQSQPVSDRALPQAISHKAQYSKQKPFRATVLTSQRITGRDSDKVVHHVELDLSGSGLGYLPGDALAVYFENDPKLVSCLQQQLGLAADIQVDFQGTTHSLTEVLTQKLELTQSYPAFIKAYAEFAQLPALAEKLDDKAALRTYLNQRQILDVITDHPGKLNAQQLVDSLRPLSPRLYSIASSQLEVEDEVHLTVALHQRESPAGQAQRGGASNFLVNQISEGSKVQVYVEPNPRFRLPDDASAPLIMIGPGTGIAPFRAFMQARSEQEASGDNWLFFGNPHFTQDFLYQVEWQAWIKQGLLNKISLAFSRDQTEKIYVQQRMREQSAELFAWLERGAHLYVCGDATRMAKDVHQALLDIIASQGKRTLEQAQDYLDTLRDQKRYQKDVY